jgi:DNA-binding MurR/RpiR family transcriptional regulator
MTQPTHRPQSAELLAMAQQAHARITTILTLTDRHRAARVHADQGDHWHHEH